MIDIPDHPEIRCIERTGYPSWWSHHEEPEIRCDECGREIDEFEDVYECRTHATLCLDCLKMLHKKYL